MMDMKRRNFLRYTRALLHCACAAICFFLASCTSIKIPGEDARMLRDLSSEYYSIGAAYAELKQYEKAVSYFKLAARNKTNYRAAEYQCGRMYAFLSRWKEAETVFADLLKNDNDNRDLQASLAYIYAMSGKLGEAEKLYAKLTADFPHDELLAADFVRILAAENKKPEAKQAFDTFKVNFSASAALVDLEKLVTSGSSSTQASPR
ncbi:MAG: hypothetical protein Ta2A_21850 [Treponemataceae bacterium]|nr:MAG: hypothetical protein Ta2A_21850 [Treponemataceae bacterium]